AIQPGARRIRHRSGSSRLSKGDHSAAASEYRRLAACRCAAGDRTGHGVCYGQRQRPRSEHARRQLGKTFRDISEVPLLSGGSGRNVLTLLGTQPGVVVSPNDAYSVNGQRAGSNNFLLDGGDSTNVSNSQPDAVNAISPKGMLNNNLYKT